MLLRSLFLSLASVVLLIESAQARMEAGFGLCEVRPPGYGGRSPAEAIASLTASIAAFKRENGSTAGFFTQRANAYVASKNFDRAISDFNEALSELGQQAKPSLERRIALLLGRGRAYGEMGDYSRALEDFEAALALRPDSADALLNRGIALSLLGQHDRAIQDFDKLILLNRGPFAIGRVFAHRGATYADKGEFDRAQHDLQVAARLDSFCQAIPNNLCWIGALQGRPRASALGSERLNAFWSGNLPGKVCSPDSTASAALLDTRAFINLQFGEIDRARAESEAAVSLAPEDGELRYMLGMIAEAQGDAAGASASFAEARRLARPGQWERWQSRQGRWRGLAVPLPVEVRAERIIRESMAELARIYALHPNVLRRIDPQAAPLRVAALLFEDKHGDTAAHCRSELTGALARTVAAFNRAVGRTLFVMSDVDHHDVLFVVGGPNSQAGVDVDSRSAGILAAETRQTILPHRKEFLSYAPPHFAPSDFLTLYYREDTRSLLYGVVSRSWKFLGKSCSEGIARDLEGLVAWGPYWAGGKVDRETQHSSQLPDSFAHGRGAIEACFLAGRTRTEAESIDCVKQLVALTAVRAN